MRLFLPVSYLTVCPTINHLVGWVSTYGRGLAQAERAWNLLAVLIVVRAFLILKREVGLRLGGPSPDVRVRLAFLPFVNWRPHVPKEYWPPLERAGRQIRFVLAVYVLALVAVLVYMLGLSMCPPPLALPCTP
jgi:uncharacterized Tic20 family protein